MTSEWEVKHKKPVGDCVKGVKLLWHVAFVT